MNMMRLDLPDMLRDFVDRQVAEHAFETQGDYVRDLIQREHDRAHLRQLLLKGAASPIGPPMDDAYFKGLKDRIRDNALG